MLLSPDQEMIRDAVRDFAQRELWPHAARWDKEHHFPKDVHQGLVALGACGICVPEQYGGAGLEYLTLALVLEEIAAGDGGTSTAQNPTHAYTAAGSYTVSLTATNAPGQCATNVTFLVTASDACTNIVSVTSTPASGSSFPLGVTAVACSATDVAGNVGTASFTVTVTQTTPPPPPFSAALKELRSRSPFCLSGL